MTDTLGDGSVEFIETELEVSSGGVPGGVAIFASTMALLGFCCMCTLGLYIHYTKKAMEKMAEMDPESADKGKKFWTHQRLKEIGYTAGVSVGLVVFVVITNVIIIMTAWRPEKLHEFFIVLLCDFLLAGILVTLFNVYKQWTAKKKMAEYDRNYEKHLQPFTEPEQVVDHTFFSFEQLRNDIGSAPMKKKEDEGQVFDPREHSPRREMSYDHDDVARFRRFNSSGLPGTPQEPSFVTPSGLDPIDDPITSSILNNLGLDERPTTAGSDHIDVGQFERRESDVHKDVGAIAEITASPINRMFVASDKPSREMSKWAVETDNRGNLSVPKSQMRPGSLGPGSQTHSPIPQRALPVSKSSMM